MRDIAFFGQRANGTFVAEIAAPGVDLNTSGRRLFTTDVGLVQIVYTDAIGFHAKVDQNVTNGPAGPVTTYIITCAGTYYFPAPLPYVPEINVSLYMETTVFAGYRLTSPSENRSIRYHAYNDHVDIGYTEPVLTNQSVVGFVARVNVLNIPWDQSA